MRKNTSRYEALEEPHRHDGSFPEATFDEPSPESRSVNKYGFLSGLRHDRRLLVTTCLFLVLLIALIPIGMKVRKEKGGDEFEEGELMANGIQIAPGSSNPQSTNTELNREAPPATVSGSEIAPTDGILPNDQIINMAPPLDTPGVPTNSPSSHPTIVVGMTAAWVPYGDEFSAAQPAKRPSKSPTRRPTRTPTDAPSMEEVEEYPELPANQRPKTETPRTSEPTQTTRTPAPTFLPTQAPSPKRTRKPTMQAQEVDRRTDSPTWSPTRNPTDSPTRSPTDNPTRAPTDNPTWTPTRNPSPTPSDAPSDSVSGAPSSFPSDSLLPTDFVPGLLTVDEAGLLLSQGLTARLIARTGEPVQYDKTIGLETESYDFFHSWPDAGAVFEDPSPSNKDGWIYVSNSEDESEGGVGAVTFDKDGNVINYKYLLTGTAWNCGGGKTPWNTWISCEELGEEGRVYQVDPTGKKEPEMLTMGREGGYWESFAFDDRDLDKPRFFVTEDDGEGALQRFTPNSTDWSTFNSSWSMLHGPGVIDYLLLSPNPEDESTGTFSWGSDKWEAQENARYYYPNTEGIDFHAPTLFFVCKEIKMMFELDLDTMQYTRQSTESGLFDGEPDQLKRILSTGGEELLFFTEDGGELAGIHGRDETGLFFTLLESEQYSDETTGLALTADLTRMYIAYQENGLLFEIRRRDGEPFSARSLDVKYHAA